jgi:hypothetical protein
MANAPRDANNVPAGLSTDDTTNVARPLLADGVTGRLLVKITADAGGATGVSGNAPRDANNVPALLAMKDDGSGEFVPIACDSDGNMLCDIIYT